MQFTYRGYNQLMDLLSQRNYVFTDFEGHNLVDRPVLLRHDIDMSLPAALVMAELENALGISSTYFVLVSSDFYNIFSKRSNEILKRIALLGHNIGLHFDEQRYPIANEIDLQRFVTYEVAVLEQVIDGNVSVVSMHRPSKWILDNDIQLEGLINTYSKEFLHDFKYLSDSRMRWRENVVGVIESNTFDRLHILTHPFWYAESEGSIKERLGRFLRKAVRERYYQVDDNFTDLDKIITEEELK